jgi:hypothetical protein
MFCSASELFADPQAKSASTVTFSFGWFQRGAGPPDHTSFITRWTLSWNSHVNFRGKNSIFDHSMSTLVKVWFWTTTSKTGYLNWLSLTIQLSKPFNLTIGLFWWMILIFFLDLKLIIIFCQFLRFNNLFLFKCTLYSILTLFFILFLCYCVKIII